MTQACADPARREIYQRAGQYMIDVDSFETVEGRCVTCGARGVPVVAARSGDVEGACVAQAAITSKRRTVVEGQPLLSSSQTMEAARGAYSLSDTGAFIYMDRDRAVLGTKVQPARNLPSEVEVVRPREGPSFWSLLRGFAERPRPPMLAVRFDKKANGAFRINQGGNRIEIEADKTAYVIERPRLLEVLAFLDAHGLKEAARIMALKERVAMRDTLQGKDADRLRADFAKLKEEHPGVAGSMRSVPSFREPEYVVAREIHLDAARTRREQEGE